MQPSSSIFGRSSIISNSIMDSYYSPKQENDSDDMFRQSSLSQNNISKIHPTLSWH